MKTQLSFAWILCGMLVLWLSGCTTTPRVETDAAAAFDASDYDEFAFMEIDTAQIRSSEVTPTLLSTVRETVIDAFKAKGYEQEVIDEADFAVQVTGSQMPRVEYDGSGFYYGPNLWYHPRWSVYGADIDTTYENALIVNIFDVETRQLVWQGRIEKTSYSSRIDPDNVSARLLEIISEFPNNP